MSLLELVNLDVRFPGKQESQTLHAVRQLNFSVAKGESLAIVGESGCGKSATLYALMGLSGPTCEIQGQVYFQGKAIDTGNEKSMRQIRGSKIAMIFQDPMAALNPTMRIGQQIAEALPKEKYDTRAKRKERVLDLLSEVRIADAELRYGQYPFEFSGGMLQRVAIAIALAGEPELILADEPTTALDVTIQKQILHLLKTLQQNRQLSLILVSHDLAVVSEVADSILVMYAGEKVEYGSKDNILKNAKHPYTHALLASLPSFSPDANKKGLETIPGQAPDLSQALDHCAFANRCRKAMNICARRKAPSLASGDHEVLCWQVYRSSQLVE